MSLISRGASEYEIDQGGVRPAALERLIPSPAMREMDGAIVAADAQRTWQIIRHVDLGTSRVARLLLALRTLPDRLQGRRVEQRTTLDDLVSTADRPGFQVLVDEPPREVAVGAIGKVWHLAIPFVHVADANAFARFDEADFVKVAWAIRVLPLGPRESRVEFELRVAATDADAWQKFRRYFRLIGPGSHFIRRTVLASIVRAVSRADSGP